jgi:hypothetical protein
MKHLLIISCLLLCSCPFEEEAEPENSPMSSHSSDLFSSSSSSIVVPSSSSVESTDPLIFECPPEDIAEYPVLDEPTPLSSSSGELMFGFCTPPKLSVEELLFGAQGGVRCVTSTSIMSAGIGYGKGNPQTGCRSENIIVSDTVNNPPHFFDVTKFKRLICPWFTATLVDNWRTLHISVNQNETGNDREAYVSISVGNCAAGFTITQSPN